MNKHRDDGEVMSHKSHADHEKSHKKSGDAGALGPDQGMPRNKRADPMHDPLGDASHDAGALGPDQGTPRSDAGSPTTHEHPEFDGGAHEHSPHMPGTAHEPNC